MNSVVVWFVALKLGITFRHFARSCHCMSCWCSSASLRTRGWYTVHCTSAYDGLRQSVIILSLPCILANAKLIIACVLKWRYLYVAGMQVHISEITAASLMSNSRLQFVDGPGVLPEVSCTLVFKLTMKLLTLIALSYLIGWFDIVVTGLLQSMTQPLTSYWMSWSADTLSLPAVGQWTNSIVIPVYCLQATISCKGIVL